MGLGVDGLGGLKAPHNRGADVHQVFQEGVFHCGQGQNDLFCVPPMDVLLNVDASLRAHLEVGNEEILDHVLNRFFVRPGSSGQTENAEVVVVLAHLPDYSAIRLISLGSEKKKN